MAGPQLPELVPLALASPPTVEAPMVARKAKPKTSREEVEEVLAMPPRVLAAGEVLDEELLTSLDAVAFVFSPYRVTRAGSCFHPTQQRQMITIYNLLPHGTKGPWCARQGIKTLSINRWARTLQTAKSTDDGLDGIQRAKRTVDDAFRGRYSPEYIREIVIGYGLVPHGQKEAWLIEHGLADHTVRRWTAMVADGDLPTRTTPRRIGTLTMDECVEIQQLRKEISTLMQQKRKLELDAKRREEAMQRALDKATERAERAELATDALGKALATMPGLPGVDSDAEEKSSPTPNNTSTRKDGKRKKR
ncbi:hypothetical protein CJ203_10705 [Corynebacterium tuscaniense]|uniref:Transposase n=1 Tax=Corynebacterium tuscaniense TaxID=302449 RepID=A0A2N6T2I8_9CORY|nr:SIMPL domain-containing protein [Corynebacterium tuscaniense]PMC63523.1 hypothetical protein CJ203_10705 [Corynebacterium tuscaniense]